MNWREFRNIKSNKVLVWRIRQDGETYHTESGHLDGAMQAFADRPGDKGKPTTKAYVDATNNCVFAIDREIRKKTEHGYIEYIDGKALSEQVNAIDFNQDLPKRFCSYKPQTSIEDAALIKLYKAGRARYTRKMDGFAHIAYHNVNGWEIYSRRMDKVGDKFPNHISALKETNYDVGTILIGEMVCMISGKEHFKSISRICRSLPEEARKLVNDKEVPEPKFVIFDILFHNSIDLKNTSYDDRAALWNNIISLNSSTDEMIVSIDYHKVTPETWQQTAKDNNWEGFVVTDGDAIPGDKHYSFDGDSKRPLGSWKLKPVITEDVVVYAGLYGTGKRLGKIGALFVKQVDPETGIYFDCGKVGSGFSEQDVEDFTELCGKLSVPIIEKDKDIKNVDLQSEGQIVIELEFSERLEESNKFRFPVFIRIRDDKASLECIANV